MMPNQAASVAVVATTLPRRYLGQLVKHFQHKLPVTLSDTEGRIEFPFGTCTVRAQPDALHLEAEAADPEALTRLQDVVARHLVRFAFRDELQVDWVAPAT